MAMGPSGGAQPGGSGWPYPQRVLLCKPAERELFIDNLLVRIHFIVVMIRWTGLAPREFEFPFPGNLTSTFLAPAEKEELNPQP